MSAPPSRVSAYVAAVALAGLGGAVAAAFVTPWSDVFDSHFIVPVALLAVAAIAGEIKPVEFITGVGDKRSLSISAPFILAIIALGGVGAAVAVQAAASIADDARRGIDLMKSIFNTAQYALSVLVGGAIYAVFSHSGFAGTPERFEARDIGPLLAAGVGMVLTNWLVVATVVSLANSFRLSLVMREGAHDFAVTNLILLSFGAIAALVAQDGVLLLGLLVAPLVGAHLFAASSARHAYDAMHDSLTGLGNRGQLQSALARTVDTMRQAGAPGPGLVLLDLDHFKDINDALGHPVGDQILRVVASRLVEAAPEGATVHRLGGDEFAVVIEGDLGETRQAAHDLSGSLNDAVPVENLELLVRASVGIAVAPAHGTDVPTLMKNADIALYHAKVERDRISTYAEEFDVNSVEKLQLLSDLRSAIEGNQLRLVYQPQVDLDTRRTVGVEALLRWHHPERGLVPPDEFIPLAENSGIIYSLTAFVLDQALDQLAAWRAAGHELRMAVNLSARHLSDLALPDQVWDAAVRHGVPLSSLVLEVTETGILSDPVRADVVIRSLRELGVEVSIDDYGTGNASLSYLKRLEIDELKIDRSFVSNILSHDHDRIIVHSTISLALDLGLRVIAEGIEDDATTATLSHHGGVIGQGYHLGRPVDARMVSERLAAEKRAATDDVTAG